MGILNIKTSQVGLSGVHPTVIYIQTNDTVATITTAGYLNSLPSSGYVLDTQMMALVSTIASAGSNPESAWYEVSYDGTNWSLTSISTSGLALSNAHILVGNASNQATDVAVSGDLTLANTGAFTIANSAITNAKVSASAAIDFSKLAALTSTNILVGNGSNVATAVAMSGDATLANTGALTIANSAVTNAKVSASAAIDFSKLAALTSGNLLVGSAGNVAASVALSGDATLSNAGALTIANNAVTTVKILDANVTLAKLASGITPSHIVKFAGQVTTVGGAAAEAFTVTGAAATDLAFVQIVNDGTSNVTVLQAVVTLNTLTVTFSANPGNDTVINYQLLRAAA